MREFCGAQYYRMAPLKTTFGRSAVDDRVRTAPQEDELDLADMRRLKAIFIGSIGNLVE